MRPFAVFMLCAAAFPAAAQEGLLASEDRHEISDLGKDCGALKTIFGMDPNFVVTIEGHCDERGSAEYNLALGDQRASSAKQALIGMGVPADKLKTISYGKERPICTDATEDCYGRNRRDHFAAGQ